MYPKGIVFCKYCWRKYWRHWGGLDICEQLKNPERVAGCVNTNAPSSCPYDVSTKHPIWPGFFVCSIYKWSKYWQTRVAGGLWSALANSRTISNWYRAYRTLYRWRNNLKKQSSKIGEHLHKERVRLWQFTQRFVSLLIGGIARMSW